MSTCGSRRWAVLAMASAFIFMAYFMQYQVSAFAYELMPAFALDTTMFSSLFFAPMLTAVFLSIPAGAAADRFGVRKVVGVCAIMALGGAVLRVFAPSYAVLLLSAVLIGFAPTALNANFMRLLGAWFDRSPGIAIGVYYACSGLGTAAALLSATLFGNVALAFATAAGAFALVAAAWWAFVADAPHGFRPDAKNRMLAFVGTAARNRNVWLVALITGFGLAAKTAYLGFLPQALQASLGPDEANLLAASVTYGGIVGCVAGPAICARRARPKLFVSLCAMIAVALMAVSSLMLNAPSALLLFGVGMSTSVSAPIVESVPCLLPEIRRCVGSAGGIIGMVSLAMTYLLPLGITVVAKNDYVLLVGLTAGCFLMTVPLVLLLPSLVTPAAAKRDAEGVGCEDVG